ncbi:MAG: TldD/PmbA family protein [Deltaproteobacteria bacterium]|nr:TldD/PmbA family protein [Deltaproteobacteria bacterium]MBW1951756.1 TldD/PmbA family protein [Deltaproteobacteria bacterium]MBW1986848.1 TldD/PmbA family protein [Deltaproteobacteria bacterium]MBW2134972.1 TldD/PmbA family protein [Deltaproteobacteria bacterium]
MSRIKDLQPLLASLVAEMEKTVSYAAALAQHTEGECLWMDSREARAEALDRQQGVVLTVFTGRSFLEYALSGLADPDFCPRLSQGAQTLVNVALQEGLVETGLTIDPGTPLTKDFAVFPILDPAEIPLKDKMADLTKLRDQLISGDPSVVNATAAYLQVTTRELFVNRARSLYQELPRVQMVAQIVLRQDDRTARLHTGHCYQGGYEHARLAPEKITRLQQDARRILMAPRLAPGTYDCIFSPDFAGIFAHEAFGHGTEADLFLQHRSRGQEFLGQKVASPLVNLYDSPVLPGQAGSFFFDHEGQLASATQIIREGILVRPITDLNSASRLGLPRTANGRRESFARKVYARMTNTYFGPGRHNFEDMLADIEFGYFLDYPSNGMEDPKGWGIQLEGLYAEEIRQGQLTGRVYSPVIVTGYVPDLLQSITMVGNKVEITGLGTCGKGHKEWVKVSDGGPYLRLRARLG